MVLLRSHLPTAEECSLTADQVAFARRRHAFARLEAVEAGEGTGDLVDVRGLVHDVDGRQVVPLADGVVIGVVRGRDLHRAGAELGLRQGSAIDREFRGR